MKGQLMTPYMEKGRDLGWAESIDTLWMQLFFFVTLLFLMCFIPYYYYLNFF